MIFTGNKRKGVGKERNVRTGNVIGPYHLKIDVIRTMDPSTNDPVLPVTCVQPL